MHFWRNAALRKPLVGVIDEENTFLEEDRSQMCLSSRAMLDGSISGGMSLSESCSTAEYVEMD